MNNGGGGDGICGAGGVGYSVGADGDDGNGADYGGVDDVAVSCDVDGEIKSSSLRTMIDVEMSEVVVMVMMIMMPTNVVTMMTAMKTNLLGKKQQPI